MITRAQCNIDLGVIALVFGAATAEGESAT
jgi:hypothetical protein